MNVLINIGLGHLGWEILPGPMGPGPWAHAADAWAPGPGIQGPAAAGPWSRVVEGGRVVHTDGGGGFASYAEDFYTIR